MKRTIVSLYEMTEYNNLYNAWRLCSTGDGKDKRGDVLEYGRDEKRNLLSLQKRLRDGTWTPDKGRVFYLRTEGKVREIHVVKVEDRIVHQMLVKAFHLDKHFVKRTFGSIKGRGTLKASKQVRRDIHRSGYKLCVKFDVKKYYPNINKNKLMELIRKRYKGEAAIGLFEMVIRSYKPEMDTSISIGALPSQNNGNYYLTPLDYFILQELKVRYYVRYVDDIVSLVKDKKEAESLIRRASEFVKDYGLSFGKIELFPIDKRRIDFCSYAVNDTNVRVRASIKYRFIHKLRQLLKHPCNGEYERNCVCSYLGFFKYSDSHKFLQDIKNEYYKVFDRIDRFAKGRRGKENDPSCSQPGADGIQTVFQLPQRRAGRNRRGQRGTRCKVGDYSRC